jgi:hypothetical protein
LMFELDGGFCFVEGYVGVIASISKCVISALLLLDFVAVLLFL